MRLGHRQAVERVAERQGHPHRRRLQVTEVQRKQGQENAEEHVIINVNDACMYFSCYHDNNGEF